MTGTGTDYSDRAHGATEDAGHEMMLHGIPYTWYCMLAPGYYGVAVTHDTAAQSAAEYYASLQAAADIAAGWRRG
jgi:hypothetical protein